MQPRYLVLDEPTSMLDPEGRRDVSQVVERLGESGRGILLITHDLAEVAKADRAVVLDRGMIAFAGSVDALIRRPEVLEACGLETPPMARLAARLRELGITKAAAGLPDPEGLVDALCR